MKGSEEALLALFTRPWPRRSETSWLKEVAMAVGSRRGRNRAACDQEEIFWSSFTIEVIDGGRYFAEREQFLPLTNSTVRST